MEKSMDMKRTCFVFLCLFFLCFNTQFILSQNTEPPDSDDFSSKDAGNTIIRGLIAGGETLLSNGIVMSSNIIFYKLTGKFSWAIPSTHSIRSNLTEPWEWTPTDGFIVNQLGHPYQGSVYFSAGRANGFNFYESAFFSAFGSSTWEVFFESNHASVNDLFTTAAGSMSFGEVLYRLYIEADARGVPEPLAFLINPMAGFHRLITGWELPDYGINLNQFQPHFGIGYAQTRSSISGSDEDLFSFRGPFVDAGFAVVYGNPFEQESRIPFNHFEFSLSFGLDTGNYMDLKLISDGYLLSFSPVYSDTNKLSTGLSLHLDAVALGSVDWEASSTINQYSNALDWTIKYQHLFMGDADFQIKFHFGFSFLAVSEYYSPDAESDLNNYGPGLNSKLFVRFDHKKLGNITMSIFGYLMWPYPGTSALSESRVNWLFTDVTYNYNISNHLSVGINHSFAFERGLFSRSNFPDTLKTNNSAKLFLAWNL